MIALVSLHPFDIEDRGLPATPTSGWCCHVQNSCLKAAFVYQVPTWDALFRDFLFFAFPPTHPVWEPSSSRGDLSPLPLSAHLGLFLKPGSAASSLDFANFFEAAVSFGILVHVKFHTL